MAHRDEQIAALEAELADLRADQASEHAARNAPRPAGIPPTWQPITFRRGRADFIVIGWLDPEYEVSAFPLARLGKGPQTPPGLAP